MPDGRELAVNRGRRAYHLAAESIADCLMAKADPKDRNAPGCFANKVEANPGFFGRAGAGGENDRVRIGRHDGADRHLVVAVHAHSGAQVAEIVDQIEGEAVVIVDQDDHGPGKSLCCRALSANPAPVKWPEMAQAPLSPLR